MRSPKADPTYVPKLKPSFVPEGIAAGRHAVKYRVEEYTKAPRFTVQERSKNRWIGGHPFFETRGQAEAYIRGMQRAYGKVT